MEWNVIIINIVFARFLLTVSYCQAIWVFMAFLFCTIILSHFLFVWNWSNYFIFFILSIYLFRLISKKFKCVQIIFYIYIMFFENKKSRMQFSFATFWYLLQCSCSYAWLASKNCWDSFLERDSGDMTIASAPNWKK